MRFIDQISLSTRMFKTRPARTFLTILGISIGIGAVLFLVSFGYGLQNVILGNITTADSLLSLDISPGVSGLIELDQESIDRILKIENVTEISKAVSVAGQFNSGAITSDGLVYGVDLNFFRLGGISVLAGDFFEKDSSNEIVISSATSHLLNLDIEETLGEELKIALFINKITEEEIEEVEVIELEKSYKIVGVIDDETTSYLYLPIGTLEAVDFSSFNQVKVKVLNNESMVKVREEVIAMGFLVSSLSDTIDQALKIFMVVQVILGLFGLIALIVSAIGMFNTMTIALLERTSEIGIMRSIGITKKDIKTLFLLESVIMGFLGGIAGVALGYLAGQIANFGINVLARSFGGQALDLFHRPLWFIGFIIGFSTLIGFLTGVFPAGRAGKLNPLEALRYK